MARAYSDDLRRKVLEARGSGSVTMRSLAERFGVSYGWVRKICAAERRTGSMARPIQQRHGPLSRIDPHTVRSLVKSQPDIVLRELQSELGKSGVRVSIAHVARVLRQLGLRLKKSRFTPPSATPKRTVGGAKPSSTNSARSLRKT